jgi:F-type H+-transporting ATPase subunit b
MTPFLHLEIEAGPIHLVMWEVLYFLALLLLVSWLLDRWLFQPILGVLAQRQARIDQAAGAQDGMLARIDELSRQQAERLGVARRGAVDRVAAAKAKAEGERAAQVARARERAEHRMKEAEASVQKAARDAERALTADTKDLAQRIAAQLLGREVA